MLELRIRGWASTARIRLGGAALLLGSRIHLGLIDLAHAVEPRLAANPSQGFNTPPENRRPWVGALVLVLLVAGVLFVGDAGLWLAREAVPHREGRP